MIRKLCAILIVLSVVVVLVSPLVDAEDAIDHGRFCGHSTSTSISDSRQTAVAQHSGKHDGQELLRASQPTTQHAPLRC